MALALRQNLEKRLLCNRNLIICSAFAVEGLELKTVDCDYMIKENKDAHHTSEYATSTLVLRRGQTFDLKMKFQRKFHAEADKVTLELGVGMVPLESFSNWAEIKKI